MQLQMALAASYGADDPEIARMTEGYREAHWKLAATKGFAALKVCQGFAAAADSRTNTATTVCTCCSSAQLPCPATTFTRQLLWEGCLQQRFAMLLICNPCMPSSCEVEARECH
jgi:hypothetical protein